MRGDMECKCKGCTERHVGCHSECEHYKEFKNKLDKQHELKHQDELKRMRPSVSSRREKRWKW